MRPTIVAIRHTEIGGRLFHHGAEIPQSVLTQDEIDKTLDERRLAEYPERRSLFRLFHVFSGAKDKEQLEKAELDAYCLPG
jgi:hypothetical protein